MEQTQLAQAHAFFATEFNRQFWYILAQNPITSEDAVRLIHLAHASLLHWQHRPAYSIVQEQRGIFLLATAYTAAQQSEPAVQYAQHALHLTQQHAEQMQDFDVAYAYLAMARALALRGQLRESMEYFAMARQAGEQIKNADDKNLFLEDFRTKL